MTLPAGAASGEADIQEDPSDSDGLSSLGATYMKQTNPFSQNQIWQVNYPVFLFYILSLYMGFNQITSSFHTNYSSFIPGT